MNIIVLLAYFYLISDNLKTMDDDFGTAVGLYQC